MAVQIDGMIIVVTGAITRVGEAAARWFSAQGAHVVRTEIDGRGSKA